MSNAPTPPPHTPINFLKGGGGAVFSADCVALLAKLNYEPSDFGSYKDVKKKCDAARKVVKDHAQGKPGARPPTEREKWLAECQAGHLGQNACRQRSRNDPCTNLVDGYSHDNAPCMPQHGRATDRDGNPLDTEHGRVTADERAAPIKRGLSREPKPDRDEHGEIKNPAAPPKPGCEYPEKDMREDDRKRTEEFLKRNGNNRPAPTGTEGKTGGAAPTATASAPAKAGKTTGPSEATGSKEKSPSPKEITGKTAADCINNFKEMAEEAMKTECKNDRQKNREIADGGPGKSKEDGEKHRQKLKEERNKRKAELAAAKTEMASANRSKAQRQRRAEDAVREYQANPTPENLNKRTQKAQAVAEAEERRKAAGKALTKARGNRNKASREYNAARNADCLANQGEALARENPRTTGRSPGVPAPPDQPSASPANT